MEVSKDQIARGLASYIRDDVSPNVADNATRIVLAIAASAIAANPKLIDAVLENPMFSAVAKRGNGYDMTILKTATVDAMDKYGGLSVTIPGIKFVSPDDKVLQFSGTDVARLVERIERG